MSLKQSRQRLNEAEEAYIESHPGRDLTEARAELTIARGEYYRECAEIVARLPELLESIAAEADSWHKTVRDDETPNIGRYPGDHNVAQFTVGDIRALARLFEEVK